MRLKRKFFNRRTVIVARELLGKYLCRCVNGKIIRVRIIETEAYCGIKDKACHASRGLTPRTKIMFGLAGYSYVYMIYGMYYCLNFVTEAKGNPSAVLIRKTDEHKGPGILCRELKIGKNLNGIDICNSKELWIESNIKMVKNNINSPEIKKGKRIGIDYAGEWKNKLWRFWI